MKTQYYTYHPHGFENEYTAIKVTTPEEDKALDKFWDRMNLYDGCRLEKRSEEEMQKIVSEEKWRRKNDEAFAYYCNLEPITVTEFLDWRNGEWN